MYEIYLKRNRPEWHGAFEELHDEMQEYAFVLEPKPEEELRF